MPIITANGIDHYYQVAGQGVPLVLVHGGFVDLHMWDPQVDAFSKRYRVIRYDLRGHGRTGASKTSKYSIELFADDLKALLDAFSIERTILCGLSLGGMIAQSFTVKYTSRVHALVLSDTAVSVKLTLSDKLQRYVLFPKWLMQLTIRSLGVERFVRFSFWLAKVTRSEDWIGKDEVTRAYITETMLRMEETEYLKIYGAIYDFDLLDLSRIDVPTLVLNGEHESRSVVRHAEEIVRRVERSEMKVVPDAGHTSNMENAPAFNAMVEEFLNRSIYLD
ncbi:MAG: alpha/beta fold hydrolase [Anaerolineales bacterium]|nr:alpha/beta fold hydrolase [Anaerolineales bacterium]